MSQDREQVVITRCVCWWFPRTANQLRAPAWLFAGQRYPVLEWQEDGCSIEVETCNVHYETTCRLYRVDLHRDDVQRVAAERDTPRRPKVAWT